MDGDKSKSANGQPNECKVWRSVTDKLWELFPFSDVRPLSNAPPNAKWVVGGSLLDFARDFCRAEKPFREEIKAAIHEMCSGRKLSLSPEVHYFLDVRAQVVRDFVSDLEISGDHGLSQTIIPFPALTSSEVLRWFMLEWFNHNGPHIVALLRLKEMRVESGGSGS